MAVITGTPNNDVLLGTAGDDIIDGLAGVDTMSGLGGNDTYYVDNEGDVVVEQSGGGVDTIILGEGTYDYFYLMPDNVENITMTGQLVSGIDGNALNNVMISHTAGWVTLFGREGNDTLIVGDIPPDPQNPNEGGSTLYGDEGNDTLIGGKFSDSLEGGTGRDTMEGGGGDDYYHVDNVNDVVIETADGGWDQIVTSLTSYTLPEHFESLYFYFEGTLNVTAYGNELDNSISSRRGADRLYGLDGNDYISGGSGNDRIWGDAGNDEIWGNSHNDFLYGGDGDDRLDGDDGNDELEGGAGNDNLLGGNNADHLEGGLGDDILGGGTGADVLIGGDGNDHLRGAGGLDRLTGGQGIDRFIFRGDALDAADIVTDFHADIDRVVLDTDGSYFWPLELGFLGAQHFHAAAGAAAEAQTAEHYIIYNTSNGRLYYDYDGAGGEDQVHFATLTILSGTFDQNDINVVA